MKRRRGAEVQIHSAPHFSLQIRGDVRESIERSACARDLRSCADPESALVSANRQNRAKPIRARFCYVRGSSPYIRLPMVRSPSAPTLLESSRYLVFYRMSYNCPASAASHTGSSPCSLLSQSAPTDPLGATEHYSYDDIGRLAQFTDRRGKAARSFSMMLKTERLLRDLDTTEAATTARLAISMTTVIG